MMRAALWLLALFALAVAFTLLARLDAGYVIIVFPPWRLELSFTLAILLLAGLLASGYFLMRLTSIALNLSGDMRLWRQRSSQAKANQALFDALRAHFNGEAAQAAKLASRALASEAPDLARRLLVPPGEAATEATAVVEESQVPLAGPRPEA